MRASGGILIGLSFGCIMPLGFAWWISLKEVSVLVSDSVLECRKLINKTSATSAEWDERVVPALLDLTQVTLPALTVGWADGLIAFSLGFWLLAACYFAYFLTNPSVRYGVSIGVYASAARCRRLHRLRHHKARAQRKARRKYVRQLQRRAAS